MIKLLNKLKNKKIYIILAVLLLVIILITVSIIFKKYGKDLFDSTNYVETSKRNTYIIENVDDTLLNNYISKKERTMVVFMATWCKHCQNEAEALNKFINDFDKYNVIIISHDENVDDMKNFLEEKEYKWFVIFDKDKKIRSNVDPSVTTIPYMALLDTNGNLINSHKGELTYDGFYNFYNQL